MGIWRNIGKIVILLHQIVYEELKWITRSFKRVKRNNPKQEVKNIYHSTVDSNYESLDEELERVEWFENPYYEN